MIPKTMKVIISEGAGSGARGRARARACGNDQGGYRDREEISRWSHAGIVLSQLKQLKQRQCSRILEDSDSLVCRRKNAHMSVAHVGAARLENTASIIPITVSKNKP
jgi:hypothetical protein